MSIRYMILHYFTGPTQRTGVYFALLASQESDNGVVVHEASEWRSKVLAEDSDYLEALLRELRMEKHDANTLFAELDSMSAGALRVVDEGSMAPEDLMQKVTRSWSSHAP